MDLSTAIRRLQLRTAHADDDADDVAALLGSLLGELEQVERRAVVRHAYWRMPDVPTAALRRAVGGDGPLRALAGRGPVVGACTACGRVVRARSRDDVDDAPGRCAECRARPAGRQRPHRTAGWAPLDDLVVVPPGPPDPAVVRGVRRWAEEYPRREVA